MTKHQKKIAQRDSRLREKHAELSGSGMPKESIIYRLCKQYRVSESTVYRALKAKSATRSC